jgi:hypothetical protein
MIDITTAETKAVSGGFHLSKLGTTIFGLAAGFITVGPVGLGIAASALVGAEGVDKLTELYHEPKAQPQSQQQ